LAIISFKMNQQLKDNNRYLSLLNISDVYSISSIVKIIIYSLLGLLIILRVIQQLSRSTRLIQNETVELSLVIGSFPNYCYYESLGFRYRLSRCEHYSLGEKLSLSGKLDPSSDTFFFGQKELIIQDIKVVNNQGSLGQVLVNKILKLIIIVRSYFLKQAKQLWPQPHATIILGMVYGLQEKLPESLLSRIKITGMQHVVVASGFNVSLIAGLSLWLLTKLKRFYGLRFWLLSTAIIIYSLISGLSPPLSRALVMAILSLAAKYLLFRQYKPLWGILVTFLFFVYINPWYLFNISFQLSMSATLGVLLVNPALSQVSSFFLAASLNDLSKIFEIKSRGIVAQLKGELSESFLVTLSAQAFTLPLILHHFGELSLISLFSNTFLLWLTPIITITGLISLLIIIPLSFFSIIEPLISFFLLILVWLPTEAFIRGTYFFSFSPDLLIQIKQLSWFQVWFCWVIILSGVSWSHYHVKRS